MKMKKIDNHGDMYFKEKELWNLGYKYVAGTDEVGRGPMAGPVVCAAVIIDSKHLIEGLNDSKKLTYKRRDELAEIIKKEAYAYSITYIDNKEVDEINVLEASRKGMEECIKKLPNIDVSYEGFVKGDATSASIAAASIIAKVERDHYMEEMANIYPQYGFEKHKGYVTKYHLEKIKDYGICDLHRKSYAPVIKIIEGNKK